MESEWRSYLLANVPGWLLSGVAASLAASAFEWSQWIVAPVVASWIVKDLLLFPVMRRFYRTEPSERRIIGECGVALNVLAPEGFVRVRGEIWRARACGGAIAQGAPIRVCDAHGLFLDVEPPGAHRPEVTSDHRASLLHRQWPWHDRSGKARSGSDS